LVEIIGQEFVAVFSAVAVSWQAVNMTMRQPAATNNAVDNDIMKLWRFIWFT